MWRERRWTWATCALAAACSVAGCSGRPHPLDIATTTSVQNSGLLDALLPAYREQSRMAVRVHAAGSGRALQMMAEGLVQLVISHAPEAEARAMEQHPDWVRLELAHNQFIIAGPSSDPARVREAADAADAFRRIAQSNVRFVSRGDLSGTHERENVLWQAAGVRPSPERLIVSGRGMSLALRHADELRGYTLSDEATYRQFERELELELLYEGDEQLVNIYAVIHPRSDAAATRLANWLVGGDGRERIRGFSIGGKPMFTVPNSPY
ncbi:MAG TPA: substrate-binding domain-containing protein [Vicinamibacterales bacterium]|nr:substrate-binding domain-containing protein [Vicinamibacterales bacterium]